MNRSRRRGVSLRNARAKWHPRACVRRAVTVRVDYATADGRVWLGLIHNLSLQGMYIDSALRHVAHEVAPGHLLTVVCVLPSGRPCKRCGVQFLEGHPHSPQLASHESPLEEAGEAVVWEERRM